MKYIEKLKDPRWQKKRLEIMQRDDFRCRACENEDGTLNVHHVWYDKNKEPWESDDDDLVTLCDYCHKIWHHIYGIYGSDIISLVVKLYDYLEDESIKKALAEK